MSISVMGFRDGSEGGALGFIWVEMGVSEEEEEEGSNRK